MATGEDPLFTAAIARLQGEALRAYLPAQRWFADKDAGLRDVRLLDAAALDGGRAYLAIFALPERERHYFIPLTLGGSGADTSDGGERRRTAPLVRCA